MKRIIVVALSTVALFSACGISLQEACELRAEQDCAKMYSCPNAGVTVGEDEASCKTQMKALCTLAQACTDGKTFDATAAAACPDDIKAQTCEQYEAGEPASCGNVCK